MAPGGGHICFKDSDEARKEEVVDIGELGGALRSRCEMTSTAEAITYLANMIRSCLFDQSHCGGRQIWLVFRRLVVVL